MSTGLRAGTNNDGYLQVNGTDVLTALSSGKIGIGTTPDWASATSTGIELNPATATNWIGIKNSSGSTATNTAFQINHGTTVTTSILNSGAATFTGNVQAGGDAISGAAAGVTLRTTGLVNVTRATGNNIFAGFKTGNNTQTSQITSDGDATFTGNITAVRGTFTDQVGTTNQLLSNRTTGSYNCYQGQLNGTPTSVITADGTSSFIGDLRVGNTAAFAGAPLEIEVTGSSSDAEVGISLINNKDQDASATCVIRAYQDIRSAGDIVFGRENAANWSASWQSADGFISFNPAYQGSAVERMRINSSGKIILPTGSPGIQFGSPDNPSASGGIDISSQTLDDYEEGTWTPTLGGNAVYDIQVGTYTKIGNLVYAYCRIRPTSLGTGSDDTISGLPFNPNGSDNSGVMIGYYDGSSVSSVELGGVLNTNGSITLYTKTSATNNTGTTTFFQNNCRIYLSTVYQTNS